MRKTVVHRWPDATKIYIHIHVLSLTWRALQRQNGEELCEPATLDICCFCHSENTASDEWPIWNKRISLTPLQVSFSELLGSTQKMVMTHVELKLYHSQSQTQKPFPSTYNPFFWWIGLVVSKENAHADRISYTKKYKICASCFYDCIVLRFVNASLHVIHVFPVFPVNLYISIYIINMFVLPLLWS